ncbi:MAG: hypothetical protein ACYC0C_10960 [Devosia sp.]
MLIYAAVALLIAVVLSLVVLLALDLRRHKQSEWIEELKQWQSLLGAVLGFLGAAGVLVLGSAIESDNERARQAQAAHAIGTGLALEVERLSVGLQVGRQIGASVDFADPALVQVCADYAKALQRALAPDTPVYDAVLGRMVDFGDVNLSVFVRFYAFYEDFLRGLPEIDEAACTAAAGDEIRYIIGQINGGLGYYEIIAKRYDTTPPQPAPQPQAQT